jgi:hypothetical protein
MVILEYYQPTFQKLHFAYRAEISAALYDYPKVVRDIFYEAYPKREKFEQNEGYKIAQGYLVHLENALSDLLKEHSVFFWLHMVRRLAACIGSNHPSKTDLITTLLVKNLMDTAIQKFAALDIEDDIACTKSDDLRISAVLGGHFFKDHKRIIRRKDWGEYIKQLRGGGQWVMTRFSPDDMEALYKLEALCYQYWMTTALMRAIGKGATYALGNDSYHIYSSDNPNMGFLLDSYDARNLKNPFSASLFGLWFDPSSSGPEKNILMSRYNAENDKSQIQELMRRCGIINDDFNPNFTFHLFDFENFRRVHVAHAAAFEKFNGYSLTSYFQTLWLLSRLVTTVVSSVADEQSEKIQEARHFLQLSQRAYRVFHEDTLSMENMKSLLLESVKDVNQAALDDFEKNYAAILADLTLTERHQKRMSI